MPQNPTFTFFGSSHFSVYVLEQLKLKNLIPTVVVSMPDKPVGRKQLLTPTPVTTWARQNNTQSNIQGNIKAILTPEKLNEHFIAELNAAPKTDVFIVASYGKIIPQKVLDIPAYKTLNVHPSLLPAYRGASPLQAAILNDSKKTGVTIIRLDAEMDHGPIIAQQTVEVAEWPTYEVFEKNMATLGGDILANILPKWIAGEIKEAEQNHSLATYTKKIIKEDAEILATDDDYTKFRKIMAYHEWPQAFFFVEHAGKQMRVKITAASYKDGQLILEKVIPEGKKEMSYSDFVQGYGKAF